jgi:hypothetical protein
MIAMKRGISVSHLERASPKTAQPKRTYLKNKPHVSTAKILAQRTQKINTP